LRILGDEKLNLTDETFSPPRSPPVAEASHQWQFSCDTDALVFYQRKDRLGARLEGMLSAWRFARVTGRRLVVFWTDRNPPGSYDPAYLFDLKAMSETGHADDLSILFGQYQDDLFKGEAIDLRRASGWPFALRKREFLSSPDKAVKIMTLHSTYFCLRWEAPWRISNELRELFSRLVPVVLIRDALASALGWIGDPDFIAVHIRRGDVVRDIKRKIGDFNSSESQHDNPEAGLDRLMNEGGLGKDLHNFVKRVASIDAYVAALPENRQARVVVFSDSLEAAQEFQARIGRSRAVLISSFEIEMNQAQRAYLELLILSKASRVISTASCFSRLACQCGRPSFHDARNALGADATRAAFQELFGDVLKGADPLRTECLRVLERELASDRWVRLPDWLIAMFPWLAWIILK
jgi:hypothetical protein